MSQSYWALVHRLVFHMKATLTCHKIAFRRFQLTAEVEVSEDLIDYEGVINADSDLDFFAPSTESEDADPRKLSHTTVLYHAVESGEIASFHFKYQTAAGAFEIGEACPIE